MLFYHLKRLLPNLMKTLDSILKLNPTKVLTGHGNAATITSIKQDKDLLLSRVELAISYTLSTLVFRW